MTVTFFDGVQAKAYEAVNAIMRIAKMNLFMKESPRVIIYRYENYISEGLIRVVTAMNSQTGYNVTQKNSDRRNNFSWEYLNITANFYQ